MAVHVLDAMAREGFEEVVALHDRGSGLRAFLAIHDTSVGPALGGVRRFAYRDEREALLDCLRLALHMSFKCALTDLPAGGAKTVVLDRGDLDLRAAYRALGDAIERLDGRYYAGPDVGTGRRELRWLSERTRFVPPPPAEGTGGAPDPGPGDLAAATAAGVLAGMEVALASLDGEPDWPRRTVVIQGLGKVGRTLAGRLLAAGARVLAGEIEPERCAEARRELGLEILESGREMGTDCDVYAPCAMGGTLHDLSIPRVRARVVCGAANNQLARGRHAERLHTRGVLYVPDFVVNSGALLRGALHHLDGVSPTLEEVGRRIGAIVERVLSTAREEGLAPARVAEREARRELARRRSTGPRPLGEVPRVHPRDALVAPSPPPERKRPLETR